MILRFHNCYAVCLSSYGFKLPGRRAEKYSRKIMPPTESKLAWFCLHVLLLPPKLSPGDDLAKMNPIVLGLFSSRISVLCCWLGTNASVSQEACPELGAKGENGAVEIKMKINPSCHGTIVLGVHFCCGVSPLFSCACLCVHLCWVSQ